MVNGARIICIFEASFISDKVFNVMKVKKKAENIWYFWLQLESNPEPLSS